MDAPTPPPGPATLARAGKVKLSGRSPLFYVAFAAGVGVLAWQIHRREAQTIPAPGADAVPGPLPPDPAIGSFQGYDTPQDMQSGPGYVSGSQLQGTDVLSFLLDWQGQRQDYYLQQQGLAVPEPVPVADIPETGGGLPNAPIPNPAPPPAKPRACPGAFPHHAAKNGPPSAKSCYKDCGHDECKKHRKYRQHAHCFQNGKRVVVGTESIPGRC